MEQEVFKAATDVAKTAANKGIGKLTDLVFSKKLREEKRLDDLSSAQTKKDIELIEKGLAEIDNRFNSDIPLSDRPKEDINFYNACSSTTQSLPNRKTRANYIKSFIE